MSSKLKIVLFFGTNQNENDEKPSVLYQIANSLAGLELNIFTENKYTNLRVLEFETKDSIDIELWIYYGSIVKNSIPGICLHQIKGIAVIGGESVPKSLLENRKQVIWFRQKTGSQLQKG